MRMNFLCKGVLVAAVLCLVPTALPATPGANKPARQPAVIKGYCSSETMLLLDRIQIDALEVQKKADQLRELLRAPELNDWRADAEYLQDASVDVNEMNKLFLQLRTGRTDAPLSEQKVIERIASTGVNLADTTQQALNTLRNNESRVYATDLDALAQDMFNQAGPIAQTAGRIQKYAEARHEVHELKQTLGLKSAS